MRQSLLLVLPLFLLIGFGWGLRISGFLQRGHVDMMNRLTFYVALPLLLVSAMARSPGQELHVGGILATYLSGSLPVVAILFAVTKRLPRAKRGALVVSSFRGNLAYVGLPVIATAMDPSAVPKAAVAMGIITMVVQVVSVALLEQLRDRRGGRPAMRRLLDVAFNPLVLGCLAGLAVRAAGVSLPSPLARAVDEVGRLALPLALLTLGASMSAPLAGRTLALSAVAAGVKVIVLPLLGWIAGRWLFGLTPEDFRISIVLLACPIAIVSLAVVKELEGDAQLCATAISLSTILSLVTLTGWLALLP